MGYNLSMDTVIDNMIEIGRPDVAIKMEWVELAYNQQGDSDLAFKELLMLQKAA